MKKVLKYVEIGACAAILGGVISPSVGLVHADALQQADQNNSNVASDTNADNESSGKQVITDINSINVKLSDSQYYTMAQELAAGQAQVDVPGTNYVYDAQTAVNQDNPENALNTNDSSNSLDNPDNLASNFDWNVLGDKLSNIINMFGMTYEGGKMFGKWMKSHHPTATSFLRGVGKNVFGSILLYSGELSTSFYLGFLAGSK